MVISFSLSTKDGRSSEGSRSANTPTAAVACTKAKKPLIFRAGSDSDSDSSTSLGSHPLSKRAKASHIGSHKSSTNSTSVASECRKVDIKFKDYDLSTSSLDPELYSYDTFEDDCEMNASSSNDPKSLLYLGCAPSATPHEAKPPVVKESQYMKGLLRTARDRQMEHSIAFDRQQLKSDLESGESVGEVFVTGAYKRKLEERRRFEEEQRRKDEEDLRNSGKGVASLHAHMLKSGIASRTNRKS